MLQCCNSVCNQPQSSDTMLTISPRQLIQNSRSLRPRLVALLLLIAQVASLLVVPMQGQYEQRCNAVALKKLGVPVLKKVKKKSLKRIEKWLDTNKRLDISFPKVAGKAVEKLMKRYGQD